MEVNQYIKTTTKTKTELLKELLAHNFFANEVLVSDDMLPHVCGSWLLVVMLKFNSEAVDDLNRALAECEAKYAIELKAQIYRAIAPIAMFDKGFRPKTRLAFVKRHLENTLAIVADYTQNHNQVLERIAVQWVNKWCVPKYVERYDNRVMVDILGMIMAELLVAKPFIENPPRGLRPQLKMRDGLPSIEWIKFQTDVLEKTCGWVDPCAFKALQNPDIRKAFGLSIRLAKSEAAQKEVQPGYTTMNVGTGLRNAYAFMRYYLNGATQPKILAELRTYADIAVEEARQTLKPYLTKGDKYDLNKARYDGIPETILTQLYAKKTIRSARPGEGYSPDTKRNYPQKERLSEYVNPFARLVLNVTPSKGRRKITI